MVSNRRAIEWHNRNLREILISTQEAITQQNNYIVSNYSYSKIGCDSYQYAYPTTFICNVVQLHRKLLLTAIFQHPVPHVQIESYPRSQTRLVRPATSTTSAARQSLTTMSLAGSLLLSSVQIRPWISLRMSPLTERRSPAAEIWPG